MDLKRLRMVKDICPLLHPHHASITSSRWVAPVAAQNRPVAEYKNGHTVALFSNRFVTWHRSFTRDCAEPPPFDPPAYIYIHEWVPDAFQPVHPGWRLFGFSQKQGVAFLQPGGDFVRDWSDHARRHLKVFKKSGATLRLGTLEEFVEHSAGCHLPEDILENTIEQATSVRAAHPEDIEILTAIDAAGVPLGFFIAAYCDEVKQSYYIGGYYTDAGERAQAMTGLVHWWFSRSLERNMVSVNFGDMCGPRAVSFDPSAGYSNFKTHFGIHRVWRPRTLWKARLRVRGFDEVNEIEGVKLVDDTL